MTDISILVVTYNRSTILVETIGSLNSLVESLPEIREIIIADDCSDDEHRDAIDSIENVRVVRTEKNSGLGANTNNGLKHCSGDLILQLQDDWAFDSDPQRFREVLDFLLANPDIGVVQLSPVLIDLPPTFREFGRSRFHVFKNDHLPWRRRCDLRPYSDHPHLKRREFVSNVGRYLEKVPMTVCEAEFQRRVANQSTWRIAMVERQLFADMGREDSLNPGGRRHWLIQILESLPLGTRRIESALRSITSWADHTAAKWMAR